MEKINKLRDCVIIKPTPHIFSISEMSPTYFGYLLTERQVREKKTNL